MASEIKPPDSRNYVGDFLLSNPAILNFRCLLPIDSLPVVTLQAFLETDSQKAIVGQRYEKVLWYAPQIEIFSFHIFLIKNNYLLRNG